MALLSPWAALTSCGRPSETTKDTYVSPITTPDDVTTSVTADPVESTSTTVPATSPSTSEAPPVLRRQWFEYQPDLFLTLIEGDSCENGPRPVMVAVNEFLAEEFAARGYVGVTFETLSPGGASTFDAPAVRAVRSAVHDMGIVVQWLRVHAEQQCLRPDAIAGTGYSFGAIVALALAYSDGELVPGTRLTIDEYDSTVTIEEMAFGSVPPELAPYSNDLDGVVSFSGFAIADHIDGGEPPAILFHGRFDQTVPFALAEKTCAAVEAVDVACELIPRDAAHQLPPLESAVDQAMRFLDREMLAPAELTETR